MFEPEMDYDLHDSSITDIYLNSDGSLDVYIWLYSIFYPKTPYVRLSIEGIYNLQAVAVFVDAIDEEGASRIDSFHYQEGKDSIPGDTYLCFEVEDVEPICIHCKSFRFVEGDDM